MDERLRELERAARASETDRVAGWAFARALERTGDRRAFFLEVARLARGGDSEAARELTVFSPRVQPEAQSRARFAITSPPRVRSAEVPLGVLRAASESVVVGTDNEGGLVAVCARELTPLWRGDATGARVPPFLTRPLFGFRGDDLVVAREAVLSLHDARTGDERARVTLEGPISELALSGDRAALALNLGARRALVSVDVGESFGTVLHGIHGLGRGSVRAGPGASAFLVERLENAAGSELEAIGFEDGQSRWRRTDLPPSALAAIDARGVVVRTDPYARSRADVVRELDPDSGRTRWQVDLSRDLERRILEDRLAEPVRKPHVAPELLLEDELVVVSSLSYLGKSQFAPSISAYHRQSGALAWSWSQPRLEELAHLALAGGLVLVFFASRHAAYVLALGLGDGKVAFELPIERLAERFGGWVPLSHALLLLWTTPDAQGRLARIEEP